MITINIVFRHSGCGVNLRLTLRFNASLRPGRHGYGSFGVKLSTLISWYRNKTHFLHFSFPGLYFDVLYQRIPRRADG